MKITPIAKVTQRKSAQSVQPNFKGLWGAVNKEGKFEPYSWDKQRGDAYYKTTQIYYPFLDETKEETEKAIAEFESKSHCHENAYAWDNGQPDTETVTYTAQVASPVPIKTAEWEQYLTNKEEMPTSMKNFIDEIISRLNLKGEATK